MLGPLSKNTMFRLVCSQYWAVEEKNILCVEVKVELGILDIAPYIDSTDPIE